VETSVRSRWDGKELGPKEFSHLVVLGGSPHVCRSPSRHREEMQGGACDLIKTTTNCFQAFPERPWMLLPKICIAPSTIVLRGDDGTTVLIRIAFAHGLYDFRGPY